MANPRGKVVYRKVTTKLPIKKMPMRPSGIKEGVSAKAKPKIKLGPQKMR